ncbi:hypothetical protein EJ07DRAFT_126131 [Lizonia empirigonia]|nr:hypothetical protein EJ07DRAFT_126131 [Lizonia empirigonia]
MVPSRAYIPSAALIRALSRPQPLKCPFARPLPAQFVRGKKSKAAKAREAERAQLAQQARRDRHINNKRQTQAEIEHSAQQIGKARPNSTNAQPRNRINTGIKFYEMDLGSGTRRQVDRFGTAESRKRERETNKMIQEQAKNPDYDDAELNRRMMDMLIADPAFAELTEELKDIKADILTKEDKEQLAIQAERETRPVIQRMNAAARITIHEGVMELLGDPDIGDAKADLEALLDKLSEVDDISDPEFQAVLHKATDKVNSNPKLQAKVQDREKKYEKAAKEMDELDAKIEDMIAPIEVNEEEMSSQDMKRETNEELYALMRQMRDLMKNLKMEGNIDELERAIAEPPLDPNEEDDTGINFNGDTNPEQLATELSKLAAAKSKEAPTEPEDDEEHISPELKAKVDKIMEDPRLMEKLVSIQRLIAEHTPRKDPNDLTQIDANLAPDPYELEDARTATLAQRMASARADPEHSAALRRLRIRLPPPFNISPALKSFNQALEFAYIGANDDVRRALWRSYQKVRNLPTFLHNMNDDAWDIIYYSQAVTWTGNKNRTAHLKTLLGDLKKVGREGPPTHPSTLGQVVDGEAQEMAETRQ